MVNKVNEKILDKIQERKKTGALAKQKAKEKLNSIYKDKQSRSFNKYSNNKHLLSPCNLKQVSNHNTNSGKQPLGIIEKTFPLKKFHAELKKKPVVTSKNSTMPTYNYQVKNYFSNGVTITKALNKRDFLENASQDEETTKIRLMDDKKYRELEYGKLKQKLEMTQKIKERYLNSAKLKMNLLKQNDISVKSRNVSNISQSKTNEKKQFSTTTATSLDKKNKSIKVDNLHRRWNY